MEKIISGGQTGVDRAALDVALERGFPCGGWCPRGRKAEDGPIDESYPLDTTPSDDYPQRTEWNVRDSDGTLILTVGSLTGGTKLTRALAETLGKPCRVVDLDRTADVTAAIDWLRNNSIAVLNVAGPRQSIQPEIYEKAAVFLRHLLESMPGS